MRNGPFFVRPSHTNRYEEVNKRIRLGNAVEGRDEKGIKKTVAAFLKILHPTGIPTNDEFEEYVAYAIKCRRRIKEQMNKRKSDDEFAKINLSFINQHDEEIVVYCPESKTAQATQDPIRRDIHDGTGTTEESHKSDEKVAPHQTPVEKNLIEEAFTKIEEIPETKAIPELKEQHFTILYGETGYSYESILTPYLAGAKTVEIEDPYIRVTHQIQNFVRFCEAIVKTPFVKKITLYTSYDEQTNMQELSDRLNDVKQRLTHLFD